MKSANLQGTRNLQHRLGHVCVSVNAACNTVVFRVDVVLMASNPSMRERLLHLSHGLTQHTRHLWRRIRLTQLYLAHSVCMQYRFGSAARTLDRLLLGCASHGGTSPSTMFSAKVSVCCVRYSQSVAVGARNRCRVRDSSGGAHSASSRNARFGPSTRK